MVRCKTIIAHLSEYLDGDTSVEMRQKIERHLRGCRRCNAVYDSYAVVFGAGVFGWSFALPRMRIRSAMRLSLSVMPFG